MFHTKPNPSTRLLSGSDVAEVRLFDGVLHPCVAGSYARASTHAKAESQCASAVLANGGAHITPSICMCGPLPRASCGLFGRSHFLPFLPLSPPFAACPLAPFAPFPLVGGASSSSSFSASCASAAPELLRRFFLRFASSSSASKNVYVAEPRSVYSTPLSLPPLPRPPALLLAPGVNAVA